MKFNTTVALTIVLLTMMLGAGVVSAFWGFSLGHEALKGVTQPDTNPKKKLTGNKGSSSGKEGVLIVSEKDILVNVHAHIHNKGKNPQTNKNSQTTKQISWSKPAEKESSSGVLTKEASFSRKNPKLNLPVQSQDKGVTLAVNSASVQEGSLMLDVSLKNQSSNPVRFLYSFLNVTDDRGRALSAITEGLPGELPANGKEFSGTVSIPTALLENSEKLSLTLTDYPDQKLQLKMSQIPVVR